MIAESDLIDVINEIHQYSMILIQMRDRSLYGIYREAPDKAVYIHVPADIHAKLLRSQLVKQIADQTLPSGAAKITLDEFLLGVAGKKAKHIWLESIGAKKTEMGFMSIRELRTFLKTG